MKITIEKRIIAFLLAVSLSLIAAVGVSADDGYMDDYTYVAYDSYGLIYLSKYPLAFYPNVLDKNITISNIYTNRIIVSDHVVDDPTSLVYILKPVVGTDTVTSYQVDFAYNTKDLIYYLTDNTFKSNTVSYYLYGSSYSYQGFEFSIQLSNTYNKYDDLLDTYKVTANYIPYATMRDTNYPTKGFTQGKNFITDPDLTLDNLIPGGDAKTIIIAISAAIESLTNTIINIGSDYIQFIPTQSASDLDSSVSSIKAAESALTGKSSSLMDSVSDQWTANKTTAKTFLTTIQPTALEIKNVYTTLTAALPDEVKALFAIIPLLLFIGLILGRVR